MVANGENTAVRGNENGDELSHVQRPPDIEQDMKEMERRKRVKMIIESQIFKEELERIIESQLNEGYFPSTLSALQQVTELISPKAGSNLAPNQTMPINDIRGVDAFKYDVAEKLLRCKLASVYRLVDLYGWSQLIYNHISLRINQEQEHFLINPFGLQYPEITASSLIKIDMQGNIIDPGSTNFTFNRAGFVLHSAIHAARPDIKAIIHIHYPPCVAVSSVKHGLLCICQEAAIIGDVSYHDFRGLAVDPDQRNLIAEDLGPVNKVLILKNHGVITCGETLEEALYYLQNLVKACETQAKLEPIKPEMLHEMSPESRQQVRSIITNFGAAVQGKPESEKDKTLSGNPRLKKWKIWDLEFESQMRMLDNAGYRTGYIYRQPLLRLSQQRPARNGTDETDIEIPPASQSHYGDSSFVDNWLTPLKNLVINQQKKEKTNWINTPNAYQKIEIGDQGPDDTRKVTKWITDSNGHATDKGVKIDSSHQFIPLNENGKREFHSKQKQMKEYRLSNQLSEGPQSKILEGAAGDVSSDVEQRVIIGAASRGIIQKEYQHNAKIYKTAYEKNPFDKVNKEELDEYNQQFGLGRRTDDDTVDNVLNSTLDESMLSDDAPEEYLKRGNRVQRSHSARLAAQAAEDSYFTRKFRSERKPKLKSTSEIDGADKSLHDASASEVSQSERIKKEKKKKSGIRAPSFLKKKKKDKKEELFS